MAYQSTFDKSARKILLTAGIILPLIVLSLAITNLAEKTTVTSKASSSHCCKVKNISWEVYFPSAVPCNDPNVPPADEVGLSNCQATRCCYVDIGNGQHAYRWTEASKCGGGIALNSNCSAVSGSCLCGGSSSVKIYVDPLNRGVKEDDRRSYSGKTLATGALKVGQKYFFSIIPNTICGRPRIGQFRINSTVSNAWCKTTTSGTKTYPRRITEDGWCETTSRFYLYDGDNRGEFYVPYTVPQGTGGTIDIQARFNCPCGGQWTDTCENSAAVEQ